MEHKMQDKTQEYMRPNEAARYIGLSESTLSKLRMRHRRADGPRYLRAGGCIIYRRSDLDAWLEKNSVEPDS